jgi:hypothetical protein
MPPIGWRCASMLRRSLLPPIWCAALLPWCGSSSRLPSICGWSRQSPVACGNCAALPWGSGRTMPPCGRPWKSRGVKAQLKGTFTGLSSSSAKCMAGPVLPFCVSECLPDQRREGGYTVCRLSLPGKRWHSSSSCLRFNSAQERPANGEPSKWISSARRWLSVPS